MGVYRTIKNKRLNNKFSYNETKNKNKDINNNSIKTKNSKKSDSTSLNVVVALKRTVCVCIYCGSILLFLFINLRNRTAFYLASWERKRRPWPWLSFSWRAPYKWRRLEWRSPRKLSKHPWSLRIWGPIYASLRLSWPDDGWPVSLYPGCYLLELYDGAWLRLCPSLFLLYPFQTWWWRGRRVKN